MNWLLWMVSCLHCRHYKSYLPSRTYDDLSKCMKHNTTRYADKTREDETKCGPQGVWYEPK
jgi:hypothetical protein